MTTLSIRPLQEEDIPNIVDYWFKNDSMRTALTQSYAKQNAG